MLSGLLIQLQTFLNKSAFDRAAKLMPTILSNMGNVTALEIDAEVDLVPDHANKILIMTYDDDSQYGVKLDSELGGDLDIGTIITFVTTDYDVIIHPKSVDMGGDPDIYGAGFDSTGWWVIPPNSMGTLLKTGENKWMVSAAGLIEYD